MLEENCSYDDCPEGVHGEGNYCIFHKPDKNVEEAREFYNGLIYDKEREEAKAEKEKLWIKHREYTRYRWKEQCLWEGYVFPETPSDIEGFFRYSVFEKGVFCNDAEFTFSVHFKKSTFKNVASFTNVTFINAGMFDNVSFKGKVRFGGTEFYSTASFRSAHFYDDASFKNTSFGGKRTVGFLGAIFERLASFDGASFNRLAKFDDVVFNGELSLDNVHFSQGVNSLAEKENTPSADVSSLFVTNKINADELEATTKFDNGTHTIDLELFGEDRGECLFNRRLESKHDRKEALEDINETLDLDKVTGVRVMKFKKLDKFGSKEAKREASRVQRISYENEGKRKKADRMFVNEMRARREQNNTVLAWLERVFFDLTCEYGTKVTRLTALSVTLMFLFGTVYLTIQWFKSGILVPSPSLGELLEPFYQSIIVFTTLGYDQRYFSGKPLLQILSGVEAIFGALLVALIIVLFARKWMRG